MAERALRLVRQAAAKDDTSIGNLALERGFTLGHLRQALDYQDKNPGLPMGEVFVELKFLERAQLDEMLEEQARLRALPDASRGAEALRRATRAAMGFCMRLARLESILAARAKAADRPGEYRDARGNTARIIEPKLCEILCRSCGHAKHGTTSAGEVPVCFACGGTDVRITWGDVRPAFVPET